MLFEILTHSVDGFVLNASGMGRQSSFSFKDLSVTSGNATVQEDTISKIKCYVVKKLVIFVGGAFSLDMSIYFWYSS